VSGHSQCLSPFGFDWVRPETDRLKSKGGCGKEETTVPLKSLKSREFEGCSYIILCDLRSIINLRPAESSDYS